MRVLLPQVLKQIKYSVIFSRSILRNSKILLLLLNLKTPLRMLTKDKISSLYALTKLMDREKLLKQNFTFLMLKTPKVNLKSLSIECSYLNACKILSLLKFLKRFLKLARLAIRYIGIVCSLILWRRISMSTYSRLLISKKILSLVLNFQPIT